jgi:hypothetical protein
MDGPTAMLKEKCSPAMVVNESQWEESTGFFPFCPPTVLSPGHRAGRHALEGQGNGDLILTTNNTDLTNGSAVFWVSPHNLVVMTGPDSHSIVQSSVSIR